MKLKINYGNSLLRIDYWQFIKAVKATWKAITWEEIRIRIAEMPWRCQQVASNGGYRVKSPSW